VCAGTQPSPQSPMPSRVSVVYLYNLPYLHLHPPCAHAEQGNILLTSILHTKVVLTPPSMPALSACGPALSLGNGGMHSTLCLWHIFAFSLPTMDAVVGRRLDALTDAAYSLSPIWPASVAILVGLQRDVRGV
jgi:cell division cycle 20-like protein 1 (cofactor of APC complex)